jgi:hypothetical protein
MSLAIDVQEQIRRYIVGFVSADELSDWLDAHAQRIHDARDDRLRRLTDLTLSLLEDVFQGHRTDEEARGALASGVPTTATLSRFLGEETGASAAVVTVSFTTVHVPGDVASKAPTYGGALTEPFPVPAQAP